MAQVTVDINKKAAQEYEAKNADLEKEYQKQKEAYENASKLQMDKLNDVLSEVSYYRVTGIYNKVVNLQ